MENRVGLQFGNYQLVRPLGQGGFAEVYLSEHIHLGTLAAIKVLRTQLTTSDIEQFRIEARTIANLEHPNIVRVLEFGVEGKTPYLVLNYAPNGTLRDRHPKGERLPLSTIVSYVKQVADALQYAHDEKVIHRDVKPENMLLGRRQEVLLSDFGIALVAQSTRYPSQQDLAGTIAYMAPEQIAAQPRSASDQYSLGIVVYEWICGERPFNGSFMEIAAKHIAAPPPSLHEKVPALASTVEEVVMTALSKDPKNRFASVKSFAIALEQAVQGPHRIPPFTGDALAPDESAIATEIIIPPMQSSSPASATTGQELPPTKPAPTQPEQRRISRRVLVAGLAGLGVVLAGTGGIVTLIIEHTHTSSGGQSPTPTSHAGETLFTYTHHTLPVYAVAWSPNGQRIGSGSEDKTVQLWNPDGTNVSTYLGHSASVNVVAWSPNSQLVASASADHTAQVWPAFDTSSSNVVTYHGHTNNVRTLAWSYDGTRIATGGDDGIAQIWDPVRGTKIFTFQVHSLIWSVAWPPGNNNELAAGGNNGIVQIWSAITGAPIPLLTYSGHSNNVKAVSWSPDGKYIASGSDDKTVHIWDSRKGTLITRYTGHTDVLNVVAWSPNGKYVASGSGDHTVQVWSPLTGKPLLTYRSHSDAIHAVAWSPDSTQVASASDDHTVKVWRVS